MCRSIFTIVLLAFSGLSFGQVPIQVPEGFTITQVADDALATNIYSLTVDPLGNTVVAGPGYIKRVLDSDDDGVYDKTQLISAFPKNGAQGLCFDGKTLYAVGDQGVLKLTDTDGDGVCDPPVCVYQVKTGGEHDAHAIRKGPDGKWYLLCGNGVPEPRADVWVNRDMLNTSRKSLAGYLLELNGDFSKATIRRYGFRNAYDFDFNSTGEVFTYDSDGERDLSLPWYQPTRVYRLGESSDAGWVSASWKVPDYASSMPEVIGRHGRGSPTGVVCYQHKQFPRRYFDAVFVLDWTVGRILVHQRDPLTGDYDSGHVFASPVGSAAFAVTDCEIAPDGSLLVSVGGRGTKGAVYRIESIANDPLDDEVDAVKGRNRTREVQPAHGLLGLNGYGLYRFAEIQFDKLVTSSIDHYRAADEAWPAMFDGYYLDDRKLAAVDLAESARILQAMQVADGTVFYEWARRLAKLRTSTPEIRQLILKQISNDSHPVDDIHYLNCLTRCSKSLSAVELRAVVNAMLMIRPKLAAAGLDTDRNWPSRMRELAAAMMREFSAAEMFANHPAIAWVDNFYLIEVLPELEKEVARMQIADSILQNPNQVSPEQISFLAAADSNVYCGLVRVYASDRRLLDAVIRSLARSPIQEDRESFLRGLKSVNRDTWRLSAIGLRKLKSQTASDAILVWQKAAALGEDKADVRVQNELLRFLRERFRSEVGAKSDLDVAFWQGFLADKYPAPFSNVLKEMVMPGKAFERFAKVDLSGGNVRKGRDVYDRLLCASCHDGGRRLGPSLKGLSNRFSDQDVLKAIVNPDQQIPLRYRALKVLTTEGETYFGSVVYESAEGIVMTDRQTNTIRIEQANIDAKAVSNTSIMPSGLLDDATDEEVVDLLSYLKSIQ